MDDNNTKKKVNSSMEEDIFQGKKSLKRDDISMFSILNSQDFNPIEKRVILSDIQMIPFLVELNERQNEFYLSSLNDNLGVFFELNDSIEYVIFVSYVNEIPIDNFVVKHRLFDKNANYRKTLKYYSTFSFHQNENSDDTSIEAITINTLNVASSEQNKVSPEILKTDYFTISDSGAFIR